MNASGTDGHSSLPILLVLQSHHPPSAQIWYMSLASFLVRGLTAVRSLTRFL